MSHIPNIREKYATGYNGAYILDKQGNKVKNEYYQEDFSEESQDSLLSFDVAAIAADNFFENLECYDCLLDKFSKEELQDKMPIVRGCLNHWLEQTRNQYGTSLRDNE